MDELAEAKRSHLHAAHAGLVHASSTAFCRRKGYIEERDLSISCSPKGGVWGAMNAKPDPICFSNSPGESGVPGCNGTTTSEVTCTTDEVSGELSGRLCGRAKSTLLGRPGVWNVELSLKKIKLLLTSPPARAASVLGPPHLNNTPPPTHQTALLSQLTALSSPTLTTYNKTNPL